MIDSFIILDSLLLIFFVVVVFKIIMNSYQSWKMPEEN